MTTTLFLISPPPSTQYYFIFPHAKTHVFSLYLIISFPANFPMALSLTNDIQTQDYETHEDGSFCFKSFPIPFSSD